MSTGPLETRMAHLQGAYEQVDARLGTIEERLGRLEDRMGRLEDRLIRFDDKLDVRIDSLRGELLGRMDRQFYWILSMVVLAILVPVFLRLMSV